MENSPCQVVLHTLQKANEQSSQMARRSRRGGKVSSFALGSYDWGAAMSESESGSKS